MLDQLTLRLFQNKKIVIPYVGTFEVQHHPAKLEFAERLLHAPYTEILFHANPQPGPSESGNDKELQEFGSKLNAHLDQKPFVWAGLGTLEKVNQQVVFQQLPSARMTPVTANKVLRENREHAVLVGDTEKSSTDTSANNAAIDRKRNLLWIGWLLVLLALLFIGVLFYKKAIRPGASQFRISYSSVPGQIKSARADSSSI